MKGIEPAVLLLLLAIDDASLPLRRNVCLHLSKPEVRAAPVLEPSPIGSGAPDDLAAHFYGTVIHDREYRGGRFRMWYYACHRGKNPDWPPFKARQVAKQPTWLEGVAPGLEVAQGPLCYAESDDGITWRKPALGQVAFKGGRDNNALDLPHTIVSGAAVIRDDADPDPGRRYKMVYQFFPDQSDPVIPEYGSLPSIACAVSPDGLEWTMTAMPFVNRFVEHCSFIRHGGAYVVHSQVFQGLPWGGAYPEGGTAGGRAGVAHATYDFDRWPDLWQWAFALPEPHDPATRGTGRDQPDFPQVHLGVGAASFGNVCVGVYGLWHDRKKFADISGDLGLLVSNDGVRFREPSASPGRPFIRREDSTVKPVPDRPFNTILCQGNGILNVGDQTRIYHGRWRNAGQLAADVVTHYRAEVALATLPRDRWGGLAVDPASRQGTVCSAAIELPDEPFDIFLNADDANRMKVCLLDEKFQPLAGFCGPNAGTTAVAGGLDCPVAWRGKDVASLRSRTVRLLVEMRKAEPSQGGDVAVAAADASDPRLYAISVKARR